MPNQYYWRSEHIILTGEVLCELNITFTKKIIVLGCGGVAQCVLPLLLKHISISPANITLVDFIDNRERVKPLLNAGVNYVLHRITIDNLADSLNELAQAGDMIIDLAWNIDTISIIDWCHHHDVLYLNTSIEEWDPYAEEFRGNPTKRTLYYRHMRLRQHMATWKKTTAPTAIIEHGANPGLISHFVKQGLIDISTQLLQTALPRERQAALEIALADKNFAQLAYITGTKVIHVSERDTQVINQPKQVGEAVNTWSVEGLYEEGVAPAEMGWGTHEKHLPINAYEHATGPCNQICLGQMGIRTFVRSWVPSGEIIGMVIRHGEAFTISEHLSLYDQDTAYYRPTVHYAYCPSDAAIASLHEIAMNNYAHPQHQRLANNEIIHGQDELGALLMGHDFNSWWTGSVLDIHAARELVPGQSATTVQVAAGVLSAVLWMIQNPERGVLVPDQLPYDEILTMAQPYLGQVISTATDWTPLKNRKQWFAGYGDAKLDNTDIWQFSNFMT